MYALQETLTNEFDWVDMVLVSATEDSSQTLVPIRYTLTTVDSGILLTIWETAAPTTSRPAAYLYKLNYRLESDSEVQPILDWYLSHRGMAEHAPIPRPSPEVA
jgi:hypothetical protein